VLRHILTTSTEAPPLKVEVGKILYEQPLTIEDMAPKRNKKPIPHKKQKSNSNKTTWIAIGAIAIIIVVFGALAASGVLGNKGIGTTNPSPTPISTKIPSSADPYANATSVLLHTNMGDITVKLRNDMPITTSNFINLVQQGKYDNTIFHRAMAGFMIQGGDPTGNGYDPSIPNIQDEFTTTNHNYNGTIAMANMGQPNSGNSQFFINVADNNNRYSSFDSTYPAFGKVVSGMDVVMAISKVPVDTNNNDKPLQNVTLINATVLH
jgi:peptidylprolyl isomerase